MRRSSWILGAAALVAAGAIVGFVLHGKDRGRADRVAAPAAPPAVAPPAPPPVVPPAPPPVAHPPGADRTPAQQEVARRALELLDDAIARAEAEREVAVTAGDAAALRELDVQLERLRAARKQRADALAAPSP